MERFDQQFINEIAEGERWLSAVRTPEASAELLDRVKQAAHGELVRLSDRSHQRRWAPWQGVAASAAALILSVTVGWQSTRSSTPAMAEGYDMNDSLNRIAAVSDSFSDLEALSDEDTWAISGASLYEAFEDALTDETGDK